MYILIIGGIYSFNKGLEAVTEKYPDLLNQIKLIIDEVKAENYKTKESKEITMPGQMLYSPSALNTALKEKFKKNGWNNHKINCEYAKDYYTEEYCEIFKPKNSNSPYRDMDFIKSGRKLGVEVQFGKYAFAVYNVCAKMTIFKNLNIIDTGIEIVVMKQLAQEMSTGVTYFEQFVWDLDNRGVSDIDIPVLIIGVDSEIHSKEHQSKFNSQTKLL